jgi:hypothetical protein
MTAYPTSPFWHLPLSPCGAGAAPASRAGTHSDLDVLVLMPRAVETGTIRK